MWLHWYYLWNLVWDVVGIEWIRCRPAIIASHALIILHLVLSLSYSANNFFSCFWSNLFGTIVRPSTPPTNTLAQPSFFGIGGIWLVYFLVLWLYMSFVFLAHICLTISAIINTGELFGIQYRKPKQQWLLRCSKQPPFYTSGFDNISGFNSANTSHIQ